MVWANTFPLREDRSEARTSSSGRDKLRPFIGIKEFDL
jgi:hypothetical protein